MKMNGLNKREPQLRMDRKEQVMKKKKKKHAVADAVASIRVPIFH